MKNKFQNTWHTCGISIPLHYQTTQQKNVMEDQVCYIDFLNKDNNFRPERKTFSSYEIAVEWGKKNLENYNQDMIRFF